MTIVAPGLVGMGRNKDGDSDGGGAEGNRNKRPGSGTFGSPVETSEGVEETRGEDGTPGPGVAEGGRNDVEKVVTRGSRRGQVGSGERWVQKVSREE